MPFSFSLFFSSSAYLYLFLCVGEQTAVQIDANAKTTDSKGSRPAELTRMDSVFIDDIGVSKKWLEVERERGSNHNRREETKEMGSSEKESSTEFHFAESSFSLLFS